MQADFGAGPHPSGKPSSSHSVKNNRINSKRNLMVDQDAMSVAATVATHAHGGAANSTALPKCFCNWKHCRTYQKTFREYKHGTLNGVVKLKFVKGVPKSMAFKAVVERTLHVPQEKRNDWRPEANDGTAAADTNGESTTPTPAAATGGAGDYVRYYVARHHFTEALMKQYLADRRAWDWNEPLNLKQAKTYLWSLDRHDIYKGPEAEDSRYEEEEEDVVYMQAPNVPKDQVRDCLRKLKQQVQEEKAARTAAAEDKKGSNGNNKSTSNSNHHPNSPGKAHKKGAAPGASGSAHTQSTLSTSVTDTLKAFEDVIGHGEPPLHDSATSNTTNDMDHHHENVPNEELAVKTEENIKLRSELTDCQEQLSMLHNMVKQLKDDMDRTKAAPAIRPETAGACPAASTKKSGGGGSSKNANRVSRTHSSGSEKQRVTGDRNNNRHDNSSGDDDEEDSDEEEEDDDEDEDSDEEEEEEWSQEASDDDDDETISTFQVNQNQSQSNNNNNNNNNNIGNRSSHSRHGSRHSVRRNSVHSRRSTVRRDSVHSRRDSAHSRRDSAHSRRNSIHSRRSIRGGLQNDDAASVHSRQSLQSVSPSIKSLPREIQLMEEEEDAGDKNSRDNDDYSFFDDSYRKPDDDARSVGSRSAASRASRRSSIVSGARSRGRNSRVGRGNGSGVNGSSGPPADNAPQNKKSRSRGSAPNGNASVPREIDLSGDELEDETYANASTDTQFVTEKNIVDPYGEKGVYTGALSKSTGMPNGKGRLEYEKEGRWYEGDWIHGRWTGYGRLSNGDGDFYEGGLKNDHKHGTGVMKFADGRVFEGEYIRGQMIQGKMTYQDGSIYGGSWVDGMRHGRGKCVFVDGSEYEGEFREGNFHGQGKMTWNDGGWYVGEWCDGEMHGRGKEIRPDGSLRHDGEWSRGQPIRSANETRSRRSRNGVEVN
jgi:hypothetical protein